MNITQARKKLETLGFTFPKDCKCQDGKLRWGKKEAEPYDFGWKNHVVVKFRDVFIAVCKDHCYVTSHIKVNMRRYRCRYWNDADFGNIFAHGITLEEAINNFAHNFENKIYNIWHTNLILSQHYET